MLKSGCAKYVSLAPTTAASNERTAVPHEGRWLVQDCCALRLCKALGRCPHSWCYAHCQLQLRSRFRAPVACNERAGARKLREKIEMKQDGQ